MNKYQEAIMLVREILNTTEPNVMNHLAANRKLDHELQELFDKVTSKKPKERIINVYLGKFYFCPNCLEWVGDKWIEYKYCQSCGQAIDWSEE